MLFPDSSKLSAFYVIRVPKCLLPSWALSVKLESVILFSEKVSYNYGFLPEIGTIFYLHQTFVQTVNFFYKKYLSTAIKKVLTYFKK